MKLTKNQKTLAIVATVGVVGGYLYFNHRKDNQVAFSGPVFAYADGANIYDYTTWSCADLNERYKSLMSSYEMELDSPNSSAFNGDVLYIITEMNKVYTSLMNAQCGQVRNPPPIPITKENSGIIDSVSNVLPHTTTTATVSNPKVKSTAGVVKSKRKSFFKWLFNIK